MTVATFANDTLTLRKIGVEFSVDLGELDAEDLRDQLLVKYPVESEATPVAGPLREVTLAEARPGDIAIFERQSEGSVRHIYTLFERNGALACDTWLGGGKIARGNVIIESGEEWVTAKNVHVYRWNEEMCPNLVPDEPTRPEPTSPGLYVTATGDQVLYNDGDICANWSRPHGGKWSTGNTYENWEVVTSDLGPERLPLKLISESED